MRNILGVGAIILCLFFLAACGGSSADGGLSGPTISTIDALPRATSPMVTSASASVARSVEKAAATGMNLWTTDESFFDTNSSMSSCEALNTARESFGSAMQADMILCYVQQMSSAFTDLTDAAGDPVNVYDGAWHVMNLNIAECTTDADCSGDEYPEGATCNTTTARCEVDGVDVGHTPNRIKMKIVKNAAGSITDFTMYMCKYDDGVLTQNEYTNQTISGASFAMRALGFHSEGNGGVGAHLVDVDGTLNSSGAFVSREIVNRGMWSQDDHLSWQNGTLTQVEAGLYTYEGYNYGSYTDPNAQTGIYSNSLFAAAQILGDTSSDVSALALGDGAVLFEYSGTYDGQSWGPESGEEAWTGDNGEPVDPASSSDYYATAADGTIPVVVTDATFDTFIVFGANETWDCTDDVSVGIVDMPQFQEATINAACSEYVQSHDWINCWETIQQPLEPVE